MNNVSSPIWNASRELLQNIRKHGEFMPERDITEIEYLDPFEIRNQRDGL